MKPTEKDLENRFLYHAPIDTEAAERHAAVSSQCLAVAHELTELCYEGRQLSLALTALEEVRMRANASIACDDPRRA